MTTTVPPAPLAPAAPRTNGRTKPPITPQLDTSTGSSLDMLIIRNVDRAAQQVHAAKAVVGLCAHLPPWPSGPIRSMADLQAAEAAAERIRVRLIQRPCPCLRGLRAHVLCELLRRWQEVARVGRLTTRVAARPSRVTQQIGDRFTDLVQALATDTAWFAGARTSRPEHRTAS